MSVAKYYPFNGVRGRLRLGLSQIERSEWIQYENNYFSRIAEKKNLIQLHGKRVLDAQEGSVAAQQELLELIIAFLHSYKKDYFSITKDKIVSLQNNITYKFSDFAACPLELISYLAVDDYCLLKKDNEDYKLIAASVCAPTWWKLADKMGKPLTAIHTPIANLEQTIGRMIRQFLCNLSVGEYYQRSNWFLFAKPDFCVFPDNFDMYNDFTVITEENIEDHLYLRTERQTFHKLKNTKNIVFGIKVYIEPISIVKQHAAIAEDLLTALETMSAEQKQALGINMIEKSLTKYLQQQV